MRIKPAMARLMLAKSIVVILSLGPTAATALDYQITLDAPGNLRPLLVKHLDIYRWRDKPALDEQQLRRLYLLTPDQIKTLIATEGYYSPTVNASIAQMNGQWQLNFAVQPGLPVRVTHTTLKVEGELAKDPPQYQAWLDKQYAAWPLKNGDIFRQDNWERGKRDLLTSLIIAKYPKAALTSSSAVVNPDTHSAELYVTLNSGAAYHFGATTIHGLHRYPPSIIERLNPISPGDPYSQAELLKFQSRLQSTPYFKSVNILTRTDTNDPTALLLEVNVVELQLQKFGIGLGVSTNSGPRGQLEYENLNSLGSNLRFYSSLRMDAQSRSLNAQIARPQNEAGYLDSVNAFTTRTDIQGQTTTQSGAAIKRTRKKNRIETNLITQYVTEHQSVIGAPSANTQALTLNYIWTYRNVDNLISPSKGYLFSTEIGGASKALLSDQDFIRTRTHAIYYYPLSPDDSLTVRGELGIVFARSATGIPFDMLFRTGGDQSVRGYAYQSLGVHSGDAVVGGRYLINGSVEYTHWLTPSWGAAIFYDRGNAADSWQTLRTVAGYGVGARWRSPIGPLNLDLAYGEATSSFRIHFNLGSAF